MDNELKRLEEFKKILANYNISKEALDILGRINLILFASITSAGRNTIMAELAKTGKYYHIRSDTTRYPRANNGVQEKNGVEYWFKSEEQVLAGLKKGKYLEAAIIHNQQVSGISIDELKTADTEDKIAMKDIEFQGVHKILPVKPDTLVLFILPPDFNEWIKRLDKRGQMSEIEKARRIESAKKEIVDALACDYYTFIINDQVSNAIDQIDKIVKTKMVDVELQNRGRELAKKLYTELLAQEA